MVRCVNKGGTPLYSPKSATASPIGAAPDPPIGSQSLIFKPPQQIGLGRPQMSCHAKSPFITLTKRDRTTPVSACVPARWLWKQLIWLADSKRVQGLTGLTRTRSGRVHSYRLHTVQDELYCHKIQASQIQVMPSYDNEVSTGCILAATCQPLKHVWW